ncbi:methyl-accepting chemotaxis protein [Castellaniella hirudinis]|uniref:methyl-accepting chemotaxis protein n=1 Tax=Castellaniella hirudinis TaxID=1144617 RepID=UPI0039C3C4E1
MRNLKITARLGLGFGLIIVLLLSIAGIGLSSLIATDKANGILIKRQETLTAALHWAAEVQTNANQALATATTTDPAILRIFQTRMNESFERTEHYRSAAEHLLFSPEAKALFTQAIEAQNRYLHPREQAFQQLQKEATAETRAFFTQDMPKLATQYLQAISHLTSFLTQAVAGQVQQNQSQGRMLVILIAAMTLAAVLASLVFAWLITRSITRPLTHAVALAEAVADHNLSQTIQATGKDEFTKLESALGQMVQGLHATVSEVRNGADTIATAAKQISMGNLDLSARTEQQSSSLAQTAATMEEITSTVRQNADNAQQANTLASTAAKTASEGGALVADLVQTMGEINSKSQQVADIIGVIDSIAFQTNILALNTAVEAARAGEQGRGFAVVAAEVRALAQRSTGAAKEIKDLIDASVDATAKGNDQAAHAGDTMRDIVTSINRVTDIMGEISAASREQTTGIEEINIAVTQMDDVTRQNASLVDESAAAASSLEDQATTLADLVATFNLGSTTQAQASPRAPTPHARLIPSPGKPLALTAKM